jgi:hypothetical protein
MSGATRKSVRAARIMSAAYQAILDKLIKRGWSAPRAAVKVSKPLLFLTILRYAFI